MNPFDFSSFSPSVAALSDGGFVVAFQDSQNNGLVSVVRFSADGQRLGFRTVAGTPPRPQTSPSVASLDTGGFVVAWNANGDVKSQAFDLALNAVGGEFTVDLPDYPATVTAGQYLANASPEVADLAGPGYVLAWSFEDRAVNRPVPGGAAVYNVNAFKAQVQLVADNGTARGSVIDATDFMPFAGRVDIAGLTSGGFVVSSTRTQDIGRSLFYTQLQIRDSSGAVQFGRRDTVVGRDSGLAGLATGAFAVAGEFPFTRDNQPLRAAVYGNDGNLLGSGSTTVQGTNIALSGNRSGFLMAAFEAAETVGGASAGIGISGVVFNPFGMALTTPFTVNTVTEGDQVSPDVAFLTRGGAVFVWRDGGTGNIKAQLVEFNPPP